MAENNPLPSECLPFIIGVTGHRDIDPTFDLKPVIRGTLTAWHNHIDANTPIWLLNGLAAGADLLVAEVALELQKEWVQGKLKIIGCLPMPEVNYKADFENLEYAPDATEQFEYIVEKIREANGQIFAVRSTLGDSDYQYAIKDTNYGELRNSLYLNQGLFVAKYSHVLLSIWDGKATNGLGGTAEITYYKLGKKIDRPNNTENNFLKLTAHFDDQVVGLVHHLPVRRYQTKLEDVLETPAFELSTYVMCSENSKIPGKLYGRLQNLSNFPSTMAKDFYQLREQLTIYHEMFIEPDS